jgi:hypothetical protein
MKLDEIKKSGRGNKIATREEASALVGKKYKAKLTDNHFDVFFHFLMTYGAVTDVEVTSDYARNPWWVVKAARPATAKDYDKAATINGGIPKV